MGILICGGRAANVFPIARTITVSPAADALFPVAGLTDGRLGDLFKFGSAGVATITADLGQAVAGDMEGTFPGSGWANASTGTGTAAQSATFAHGGTKSAKVNGGAAGVGIYRHSRQLRPGFRYRVEVWARNTSTATAKLRISNPETGKYLQASGGAWGVSSADVATTSSSTFTLLQSNFTVESYKTCGRREFVTVYFDLVCTQNEDVYFDDMDFWPEVDFVAVFGHNHDAALAPEIRSSTDNFSGSDTLEATMTPKRPAYYNKLSASITRRYIRLKLPATNTRGPASFGELWGSQYLAPRRAMSAVSDAPTIMTDQPQIESGDAVFLLSDEERRLLEIPLLGLVTADHEEIRDEILARAAGSGWPIVVVPDDINDPDLIIFGRKDRTSTVRRVDPLQMREVSLRVREMAYSTVVG